MIAISDFQEYNKDLFIFGENIQTSLGIVRFLTFKEYVELLNELSYISQNTLHIYYNYKKSLGLDDDKSQLEQLKNAELLDIVNNTETIKEAYTSVFLRVFDNNDDFLFSNLFFDSKRFMFFRKLIMDMNMIKEEKVSHNEELQAAFDKSKLVNQPSNGEKQSYTDILTSIVATTSLSYQDVGNLTLLQTLSLLARVGAVFNYNTSTLFATVAEKVDISSWNKHIDLFSEEKDYMTQQEFSQKFGGFMSMN